MKVKSNLFSLIGDEKTITEAAKEFGISTVQLYHWERFGCSPWKRLKRIADCLGCSIDDLFTVEDGNEG